MNRTLSPNAEPDEQVVTEVHCAESGLPIPSIPAWYSTVNVKFVSEAYRQKAPSRDVSETSDEESPRGSLDSDAELELPDEIEIDEEIEDSDSDDSSEDSDDSGDDK